MAPVNVREKAARALCRKAGHPENIAYEGGKMWESFLPEVDTVLKQAGFQPENNNLVISLGDDEAEAFAQFLKRVDPEDFRKRAGDQQEANRIESVALTIRKALEAAGFAPR